MQEQQDSGGKSFKFIALCAVVGFMGMALPMLFMLDMVGYVAGSITKLPGISQAYGGLLKIGCASVVKKPTDILLEGGSGGLGFVGNIVGGVGDFIDGAFEIGADGVGHVPVLGGVAKGLLNGVGDVASAPFDLGEAVADLGSVSLEQAKNLRDVACKRKEVESGFKRRGLDDTLRAALYCGDLEKKYGKQILGLCIKGRQANDSTRDVPAWLLPVYQAAGDKYGVPWELLAAINWNDTEYGGLGNWQERDPRNRRRVGWIPFTSREWRTAKDDGGWAPPHNSYSPYRPPKGKKFSCPMPVNPRKGQQNRGTMGSFSGVPGARQLPRKPGQQPVPRSRIPGGRYRATAYGPPWDGANGMEGSGITSQGTKLGDNPGPYKKYYLIAVDPHTIPYGSYVYVWPNPFNYRGTFKADDTGGAFLNQGKKLDFYDWRGRTKQNAWGVRYVTVTPADGPSGDMPSDIPTSLVPDSVYDACDPVDGIFALAKWLRKHGVAETIWKEAIRLAAAGGDQEAAQQQLKAEASKKFSELLKGLGVSQAVDVLKGQEPIQEPQLRWPTESHDVARAFGLNGESGFSSGLLVATRTGEPVRAMEDGKVLSVNRRGGFYGSQVCQRINRLLVGCLGGLKNISVHRGQQLKAGQQLAKSSTIDGQARVYIELRADGKPFDPLLLLPFELGGQSGGAGGGPIAERIVKLAKAEYARGVKEIPDGSNNAPAIARYRTATVGAMAGAPWCSYFTSWIAKQAGVPVGNAGEGFGFAQDNYTWGQTKHISHKTAQAGDLIVFGGSGHVGVVIAKRGDQLTTIEGNASNRVSRLVRNQKDANVMGFVRLAELRGQRGGGDGDSGDMASGDASSGVPREGSGSPRSYLAGIDGVIAQTLSLRDAPIDSMLCPDASRYAQCIAILYLRILRGPREEEEELGQDLGGGCGAGRSVPDVRLRPTTNAKLMQDKGKKGLYNSNGSWGRTDAITATRAVFTLFQRCHPKYKKDWTKVATNDWGSGAYDASKAVSGHASHQNGGDNDTTTKGVSEYVSEEPYSRKLSVELASMFLRAGATEIYYDDERVQGALAKLRRSDRKRYPAAVKQLLQDGSWRDQPVTWAYAGGAAANTKHHNHFHVRWYSGAANNTNKNAVKVYLGAGGSLGAGEGDLGPFDGSGSVESAIKWAKARQGRVSFTYRSPTGQQDGLDQYRVARLRQLSRPLIAVAWLRQHGKAPLGPVQRRRLSSMLSGGDGQAAELLYQQAGGAPALAELGRQLNLVKFTAGGGWPGAKASSNDLALAFRGLRNLTPAAHRTALWRWLQADSPAQSWGIPQGWPGNAWAVQDATRPQSPALVHQCAVAQAGVGEATLCVMSTSNPSLEYGQETVAGIAERLRGKLTVQDITEQQADRQNRLDGEVGKGWSDLLPDWACLPDLDLYGSLDSYTNCGSGQRNQPSTPGKGGRPPIYRHRKYNLRELTQLALWAGWKGENAAIAVAVIMGESGGKPDAYGRNKNGTYDRGLWMLNSRANPDITDAEAYDVVKATRKARRLWLQLGWKPWYAWQFRNQPYRQTLPRARRLVRQLDG